MAFKKSKQKSQPDLFATASFSLPERERRYMEDELSWHNEFYRNVLLNIDEEVLRPLFVDGNMGAPTKQLRILVAMRILKEGRGCSDEQLYENVRFNLVWRQAVGLFNINDECPSIDSYYKLFRRIAEYEQNNPEHVNLYKKIYQDLTAKQIRKYKIAGRTIRMDSKLIGSNIAWFSRYEIIHETFRKQVSEQEAMRISDQLYRQKALDFLAENASKTVYRSDDETLGQLLLDLGIVISHILALRGEGEVSLLHRVFHEQYEVDDDGNITVRDKKLISATSVQNPNDPDAAYRSKGGKKVKGYSTNITETCDEEDGSELVASGLQGKPSRFDLELQEDGSLEVTDKQTAEVITATKVRSTSGRSLPTGRKKDGQWKIAVENSKGKKSYRYFDNDAIERSQNRQRMETIPWEERKKCNNVEATIFQYCFLTRNNKTRYRGLFKQTLQALARCAWINMRRLFLFDVNTANLALQKA
ncbi:MAG: transposase [Prevotella sp.]|nr:transposase [Prevotella sp.]